MGEPRSRPLQQPVAAGLGTRAHGSRPGRAASWGRAALTLLALSISASPSCVRGRSTLTSLDQVGNGQVAVVGRVELVPPLIASDQHIDTLGSPYEFENTAYLILDDELHVFEEEPGPGAFEGHLEARLGETFHVLVPARRHYISLGMIVMGIDGRGLTERAYLPGQLELDLRPGDRAVDIGVIRYHRNPYLEVEGIEVADDHAATAKQFAARFGSADGLVHRPARVLGVTRETAR